MNTYCTARQFALFRILFGTYLTWHFATLIPYASELFSREGMIPDPNMNPTSDIIQFIFPAPLLFSIEEPEQVTRLLYTLVLVSLLFAGGVLRPITALFLWFGWTYLFLRNNLIANPGIPYVGWLLLVCTIVPSGEGYYIMTPSRKANAKWYLPPLIYWGAWFLMALGYTISGIHKLQCPSWIDGSALTHVLNSMLARDNCIRDLLLKFPFIVQINTLFSLVAEIMFLPLGLFYYTRKWFWLFFLFLHIGILTVINFTDLTLGVLMIHLFTFDNRWLQFTGASKVKSL